MLVDVVLGGRNLRGEEERTDLRSLSDSTETLGHNDHLLARDVVLLESLSDNNLRLAVRVDISRVPGVQATVIGSLQQRECLVFLNGPIQRPSITEAHTAKDGHGNAETAVAQPAVFTFGVRDRLLEAGGQFGHLVRCACAKWVV